jgi:hypothetical protein
VHTSVSSLFYSSILIFPIPLTHRLESSANGGMNFWILISIVFIGQRHCKCTAPLELSPWYVTYNPYGTIGTITPYGFHVRVCTLDPVRVSVRAPVRVFVHISIRVPVHVLLVCLSMSLSVLCPRPCICTLTCPCPCPIRCPRPCTVWRCTTNGPFFSVSWVLSFKSCLTDTCTAPGIGRILGFISLVYQNCSEDLLVIRK